MHILGFIRYCQIVFQSGCSSSNVEEFQFLHFPISVSVFHLAHLNYGKGGIILTCGFNLLFHMTHEVECHLFVFTDNFSSLSDEVSKSSAYFSIGLPFFSHGFLRVLYIFQMCILSEEI